MWHSHLTVIPALKYFIRYILMRHRVTSLKLPNQWGTCQSGSFVKSQCEHRAAVPLLALRLCLREHEWSCCHWHLHLFSRWPLDFLSCSVNWSFFFRFSKIRDELIQMKPQSRTNGSQPFSLSSNSSSCSAPSSPSHPVGVSTRPGVAYPSSALMQSPTHKPQGGGVKKVTGVGGTTYEISVWVEASLQLEDQ